MLFFRMTLEGMRLTGPFGGDLEERLPELPICCVVGAASAVKLTEPGEPPAEPDESAQRDPSAASC